MGKLQWPLAKTLRPIAPSEPELRRLWSGVEDRLERPRRRRWLAAPVFAAALLCALWIAMRVQARRAGPLAVAGDVRALSSPGKARTVRFADGSTIALEASGVVEPLASAAHAVDVDVALRTGGAQFAIAPSSRRWTIDTGLGVVEVVRTARFAVWRTATGVDVQVFAGTIVLRGAAVPDGLRQLGANERLHLAAAVPAEMPVPGATAVAAPARDAAPKTTATKTTAPKPASLAHQRKATPAPQAPATTWRSLADDKKFADAYARLGQQGVAAEALAADTVDDLLRLSDVARLSGHPLDALPSLDRIVREFPADHRASIAAFTRGRISGDDLHDPRAAAAAFARALSLELPDALRETAQYRLAEAYDRAGDAAAAKAAARDYRVRYPDGRYKNERLIQDR